MKSKRPWKGRGEITKIERNNGDVQFETRTISPPDDVRAVMKKPVYLRGTFENLSAAEADLDAWWAGWWPVQVKHRRKA